MFTNAFNRSKLPITIRTLPEMGIPGPEVDVQVGGEGGVDGRYGQLHLLVRLRTNDQAEVVPGAAQPLPEQCVPVQTVARTFCGTQRR